MASKIRNVALLFLLGAACATGGGGGAKAGAGPSNRYMQADHRMPEPRDFREDAERARIEEARRALQRGSLAASSGNMDQARSEWASSADQFAEFVDKFPSTEWRVALRYVAADLYMRAQQPAKAATQAERILVDPRATDKSKAMASHLAAIAWQNQAVLKSKAGQLDPIRLPTADQRGATPLNPRPPAGEWKRFVEATDQYLKVADLDPDLQRPAEERRFQLGPAQLALIAAEVEYAYDNMEDARGRFEQLLQKYPNDPNILEDASRLYLETFLALGDQQGFQAAVQRMKELVSKQQQAATDAKAKEAFAKIGENVSRYEAGTGFTSAARLLQEGKPAEAGEAFEKFAAEFRENPDAPNALFNAGIAYDKANQPEKAAKVREALITQFPDSKTAPEAALMLAGYHSKKENHAEASRIYGQYLEKWPDGKYKCIALQNVGYELDVQNKRADAAERYLAFGTDEKCSKEDPNATVKTLFRAGQLFEKAKQRAKAKAAYAAAGALEGVTDVVAQSQMKEARAKAKRL